MKKLFLPGNYRKFLLSIFFVSLVFTIISAIQITQGNIGTYEPLFFGFGLFYGAFMWGDLFALALLWTVLAFILIKLKYPQYFGVAFYSFWFVRSCGEVLYSFLQQFHPTIRTYGQFVPRSLLLASVNDVIFKKYWAMEQLLFQSIAILSLVGLIYTTTKLLLFLQEKNKSVL